MWVWLMFQLFFKSLTVLPVLSHDCSHETDFFGGPITPDFLFNRVGPLMLMTYLSVVVECLGPIFIWPKATRLFTLINIIGLHLGIEISMSMHSFEWNSILGWLFFLVEPVKQFDDQPLENEGQATDRKDTTNKPSTNILSRATSNVIITLTLTFFFLGTVPLAEVERLTDLLPNPQIVKPNVSKLREHRQTIIDKVMEPYLTPLGLCQYVWAMFWFAPDESVQFEAQVDLRNGTSLMWNSPDWTAMTWYERKRYQRPMTWHEHMAADSSFGGPVWDLKYAFARKLARDHGDDVVSVGIFKHTSRPPALPKELGFWDEAKQPLSRSTQHYFTLNICNDFNPECEAWAENGDCRKPEYLHEMVNSCRRSCEYCHEVDDLSIDMRVSLYWEYDGTFYDATIRDISDHPKKFKLEWDEYNDDAYRFEWMDRFELQQQSFIVLPESATAATDSNESTNGTDKSECEL